MRSEFITIAENQEHRYLYEAIRFRYNLLRFVTETFKGRSVVDIYFLTKQLTNSLPMM